MVSDMVVPAVDLGGERSAIDVALARACETLTSELQPEIADAIRYSVRGPGKRLRGILVALAYRASGGTGDPSMLAAAVEMIHAYSLVHDDLPCMDDDDMRRGRPTTHRAFGTEHAVTAGVVMIPLAVRCVTRAGEALQLSPAVTSELVQTLMSAAGVSGMIGGQWLDLQGERASVSADALEAIHRAKTGALIAAAAKMGGIAAGASSVAVGALAYFGEELGLAFQIVDDVLDVTATSSTLGKTAGRDAAMGKSTYPALLGVTGALDRAHRHITAGCGRLRAFDLLTPELRHIADLVLTRTS